MEGQQRLLAAMLGERRLVKLARHNLKTILRAKR